MQARVITVIIAFIGAIPVSSSFAASDNLRLKLASSMPIVRAGSDISCVLSIEGIQTDDVLAHDPGFHRPIVNDKGITGFQKLFSLTRETPGTYEIGPFELEFQGTKLKSNTITVTVLDKLDPKKPASTAIYVNKPRIRLGESTDILLDSESSGIKVYEIQFDRNLAAATSGTSSSINIIDGKQTMHYSYAFVLTPRTKGHFILSKDTIKGIPTNIDFKGKAIDVE